MYLAGVSVRRVEDITEALRGTRVSPSTVSELNQKIYATIEAWRARRIDAEYPYVFLDGIYLKRSWGGEVRNVSVLVAIGVGTDGFREVLGVAEGIKEDKASWENFLRSLKERGLTGVKLITSDRCLGLVESLADFYPDALWQRCVVHFYRNVFSLVPSGKVREVATMLKAIHAQEARAYPSGEAVRGGDSAQIPDARRRSGSVAGPNQARAAASARARSSFHALGVSSAMRSAGCVGSRSIRSRRYSKGSMPWRLAVSISE